MTTTKRILCFGDSLTWGWIPTNEGAPTSRYPINQRWTGAMLDDLGDGYEIIEEGLSSRTTNVDDPVDGRLNGARYLPTALASHLPLDFVVLLLGTNDTKPIYNRTAYEIAYGMAELVGQVQGSGGGVGTLYPAPRVVVVAPPRLGTIPHPWFGEMFAGAQAKTEQLPALYAALASFAGVAWLDAGAHICTDGVDGIHLSAESNTILGRAVAQKIRELI
ncbi:SGNH/GDSL hydrolase family protein [Subtercola frigoramans]|uniref:Lysophospholipase L1-like esterase n=1 Tax=Subtercola frigoramans TaxID=120298 RepID=A0ABS2L967_9MICO|nr:SGNH/GDSL hydrolase family protein [Subtercola frigoramans]MBM7473648.1 lysophospholipase L1-like esterase [Subtercola frigoramans]